MSSKKQDKTKITAGGQPDPTDGKSNEHSGAMHHVKERDQAKNKDDKHGSGQGEKASKKDEKPAGNGIKETLLFLNEVKNEARKITWPPKGQVAQETWSVIVLVTFITVMVLGFDYALGNWVFGPIEHFAKILAPQSPEQKIFSTTPLGPGLPEAQPPAPAPGDATTPTPTAPTPTPQAATPPVPPQPAGTATPLPGDATQPVTTPPVPAPQAATPPVTPTPAGTATPAPIAPPATPAPTSAPNPVPPTPPHP
ncbi:MAG: preprotein translocase subunit SecE [Candidatus Obscuribacterales bacterium]|nr:preprotein translocase subunit SecE [Candidatus Obscuribacterales bacterium]